MSSTTPLNPLDSPNPLESQESQSPKVGEIVELVHIIGGILHADGDYQSLGRMSAACWMYKEDCEEWLKAKKSQYKTGVGYTIRQMSLNKRRIVECAQGCGRLGVSTQRGFTISCCGSDIDGDLISLRGLRDVQLAITDRPLRIPSAFKVPFLKTLRFIQLLLADSSGFDGRSDNIPSCPARLFVDMKTACPILASVEFTVHRSEAPYSWNRQLEETGSYRTLSRWALHAGDAGITDTMCVMAHPGASWSILLRVHYVRRGSAQRRRFRISITEPDLDCTTLDTFCHGLAGMTTNHPVQLQELRLSLTAHDRSPDQLSRLSEGLRAYLPDFEVLGRKLHTEGPSASDSDGAAEYCPWTGSHPILSVRVTAKCHATASTKHTFEARLVLTGDAQADLWELKDDYAVRQKED